MPGAGKTKSKEAGGLIDTFVLKVKFKGHSTWRIVATNRQWSKLQRPLADLADQIETHAFDKMNGTTGTIAPFKPV